MKIRELQLYTGSINLLTGFYSEVLGLAVSEIENGKLKIKVGATDLNFIEEKSTNPYYHFAINIPENQINEAIEWLKPKVILIESNDSPIIDFPNWNAHSVYFYDPAGNIVELIARHDLKNASDEPFSAKSFLNISEIGMPVPDVKIFNDELNEKFGEKLWSGNLESFAAIGDQNGLFIVVTTHRNWFPTDKPCNIFPLTVKIENKKSVIAAMVHSSYKIIVK
jgi:catechol-2,3-dioxygenase